MLEPIKQSLSFDPVIFLYQVVVFIVLWNVMSVLFWKPMLARLRARDQAVRDAYHTIEDVRHEMEALRADYQTRIAKIEAEARAHIQAAIKQAQAERERLIAEARTHAEATLRQGTADIEREKAESLRALRERMVGLALVAVDKALGPVADPISLRRSIEERITREAFNGADPARN